MTFWRKTRSEKKTRFQTTKGNLGRHDAGRAALATDILAATLAHCAKATCAVAMAASQTLGLAFAFAFALGSLTGKFGQSCVKSSGILSGQPPLSFEKAAKNTVLARRPVVLMKGHGILGHWQMVLFRYLCDPSWGLGRGLSNLKFEVT